MYEVKVFDRKTNQLRFRAYNVSMSELPRLVRKALAYDTNLYAEIVVSYVR